MAGVKVEREQGDERIVWDFFLDQSLSVPVPTLLLARVEVYRRESPKHKFKLADLWARNSSRESTMPRPEVSKEIERLALARLVETVVFK